jgi:hypothetical protein
LHKSEEVEEEESEAADSFASLSNVNLGLGHGEGRSSLVKGSGVTVLLNNGVTQFYQRYRKVEPEEVSR